jgi:hypothetical protein
LARDKCGRFVTELTLNRRFFLPSGRVKIAVFWRNPANSPDGKIGWAFGGAARNF